MRIPFEKHVLPNGLEVILHPDRSDPLVAVFVTYHVGSARERRGRSGFAHLFEHMLFQGSENVPEGEHFRRVQEAGGTLNGSTNQDRTNYYEVLPANALEMALFLEADRMGRLLPAMTQAKLDNQRDVVKNERRQSYDNRPYGRVHETLLGALYPAEHPYSWPTIGSMEDIDGATLDDVAEFFRRWYGPNNATLGIGGDFDPDEALELVERHFGGLPPCPPVDAPAPRPAPLERSARLVLEDRVGQPQLSLAWPTVHAWHPDEAALDLLADVVSANKASLLDRVLILEERLATDVAIWPHAGELAGFLRIDARPTPGTELSVLERRIDELLADVVGDPARHVDPERLRRLIARREGGVLRGLETVAARVHLLSSYNVFTRDPGRIEADLERHRQVSAEDVVRAARRWVVGRPRVALSVVPEGRPELAARAAAGDGAARAERRDPSGAPARIPAPVGAVRPRGPEPWHARLGNGVPLLGTRFLGVPTARLSVRLDAGQLREGPGAGGLAALCAELLDEGTARHASAEWTDVLDGLGATFDARSSGEELVLALSVLDERLPEALGLVAELLRGPRFDPADVERARARRLVAIETLPDRASHLATLAFQERVFGRDDFRGASPLGTREGVSALGPEQVRAFWRAHGTARGAQVSYVGARPPEALVALLEPWCAWWGGGEPRPGPEAPLAAEPRAGLRCTLVPKPGAPQAELRVGHASVSRLHPDFYSLGAVNHMLGGAFSSRINLNLREDKGYTYGARSSFVAGRWPGHFVVATAVDTANVAAALREIRHELEGVREGFRDDEVGFMRRAMTQSLSRAFESTEAKLGLLQRMAKYGLPDDHVERRHAWLSAVGRDELDALAREHVRPDALEVVVVGDPALRAELESLGSLEVLQPESLGSGR